ncbi:MAG: hypothetical protein JWP38_3601 [Herbaspirillum sp.]|jgi:hypothetical protein|nr:hypothetical protein [Herbaspirillum sp.]
MKVFVFALLLFGSTFCMAANAAQWTPLGENDFGSFYVDKDSVSRSGDLIEVDTLLNWVDPHLLPGTDDKFYQSEVARTYLNCEDSEFAFGSRTMYAADGARGRVIFNVVLAFNDIQLRAISNGSTGERLMQFFCSKATPKRR